MKTILETLYGRSVWKPILCFGFPNGLMTWAPKAEEGRRPPRGWDRLGVWGGTVETYERGFNQQAVKLCFVGIDVDHKKGDNGHITDGALPDIVSRTIPEAYVRTSSGGLGAHVFLLLHEPIDCYNKLEAAAVAQRIAAPYANRLRDRGIMPDIVAHNQLWVVGGQQRDVWGGDDWIQDQTVQGLANPEVVRPLQIQRQELGIQGGKLGPKCTEVYFALFPSQVIPEKLNTTLHIKTAQDLLRGIKWLEPSLTVKSTGAHLDEPNASLRIKDGCLELFSFTEHRTVFKIPTFL